MNLSYLYKIYTLCIMYTLNVLESMIQFKYNSYHPNCTVWTVLQIYPVKSLLNNKTLIAKDVIKIIYHKDEFKTIKCFDMCYSRRILLIFLNFQLRRTLTERSTTTNVITFCDWSIKFYSNNYVLFLYNTNIRTCLQNIKKCGTRSDKVYETVNLSLMYTILTTGWKMIFA